jgi:hypothetical protein
MNRPQPSVSYELQEVLEFVGQRHRELDVGTTRASVSAGAKIDRMTPLERRDTAE